MIQLSIIIPVLNEEKQLPQCLQALPVRDDVELILIDGGSSDNSLAIARQYNCITTTVLGGRAKQLQQGAHIAQGQSLLFLHADCLLPSSFDILINETLKDHTVSCGAFSLAIDAKGLKYSLVSWGANLRSRRSQLPYGDQGLFMKKSLYEQAGGFPTMPIMEDYVFVKTLGKFGKVITLPAKITTSARRWRNMGVIRTTLINQAIVIAYKLGIAPQRLSKMYNRLKGVATKA